MEKNTAKKKQATVLPHKSPLVVFQTKTGDYKPELAD